MAKRKTRLSGRNKKPDSYPGWAWMLFGLAIGLSVAFAIYVKDREPVVAAIDKSQQPASLKSAIDEIGDKTGEETATAAAPTKKRFDFYDMLPAFEVIVDDEAPAVDADTEPQAIDQPGVYMLQAGSFSTHGDADRRRAELALHGIESRIQRATVNKRNYHRVYVGPIDDLDELNILRSRLRAAKIDVLRIRLGD